MAKANSHLRQDEARKAALKARDNTKAEKRKRQRANTASSRARRLAARAAKRTEGVPVVGIAGA